MYFLFIRTHIRKSIHIPSYGRILHRFQTRFTGSLPFFLRWLLVQLAANWANYFACWGDWANYFASPGWLGQLLCLTGVTGQKNFASLGWLGQLLCLAGVTGANNGLAGVTGPITLPRWRDWANNGLAGVTGPTTLPRYWANYFASLR